MTPKRIQILIQRLARSDRLQPKPCYILFGKEAAKEYDKVHENMRDLLMVREVPWWGEAFSRAGLRLDKRGA